MNRSFSFAIISCLIYRMDHQNSWCQASANRPLRLIQKIIIMENIPVHYKIFISTQIVKVNKSCVFVSQLASNGPEKFQDRKSKKTVIFNSSEVSIKETRIKDKLLETIRIWRYSTPLCRGQLQLQFLVMVFVSLVLTRCWFHILSIRRQYEGTIGIFKFLGGNTNMLIRNFSWNRTTNGFLFDLRQVNFPYQKLITKQ